ncbi:peptidoglycan-binding protein [Pseudomonas fluorescens]|uniref:peptidoglycan-binding domain-containing protein n=1 Tax=Pseudomonas fluorescens TaxID=294 RepID=UPI000281CA2A
MTFDNLRARYRYVATVIALLLCIALILTLRAITKRQTDSCTGNLDCNASIVLMQVQFDPARNLIRWVQASLGQRHYYTGCVDGDLGQWTQLALSNFQHDMHLSETGSINSSTLEKLSIPVPPWLAASATPSQDAL